MDIKNSEKWFLWMDGSHSAADNMALDEALLESLELPLVRFYSWSAPSLTIGVAQKFDECNRDGFEVIRRQTGGGVVDHVNSYTYTVVLPISHKLNKEQTLEAYRLINEGVSQGLALMNMQVELTEEEIEKSVSRASMVCAQHPTKYDIVNDSGKVSGCAQRRTKKGILHQGYIECSVGDENKMRKNIIDGFKNVFGCDFIEFKPDEVLTKLSQEICEKKYGSEAWNRRK